MERWLACTVLAAFILGDPAGAEEATGRDRYWIDAAALKWKIGDAPQPTPLVKPLRVEQRHRIGG